MGAVAEYDRFYDEVVKWHNMPPWEAQAGMMKAEALLQEAGKTNPESAWLALMLVPALPKIYQAQARLDRRIAMLQTIEAVRLYAAAHDGKLPAKLADITDVPLPVDPATGQAFEYTLRKDGALLFAPPPPGVA